MPRELIYPYRLSRSVLLGFVLFGLCTILFAYQARTNTKGLIIDRVIELGPRDANIFYGVLAVTSIIFVMAAIASSWIIWSKKPAVMLGASELRIPIGMAKHETALPYADIRAIQDRQIGSQKFLVITRGNGKQISTSASLFHSKQAFGEFRAELTARTRAAHSS